MAFSAFSDPAAHARISSITRRHSTNQADVREVVLSGLDLQNAGRVLDLGCGFGFWSEALARRLPQAQFVGVDVCAQNCQPFMDRVQAAGGRPEFVCRRLGDEPLPWPDAAFDLVVAGYSLYFFPQVVPEVARVLRADGLFIAVTHTERSCRDLLAATGLSDDDPGLVELIRRFSAENGDATLRPFFRRIQRVDYRNSLVFDRREFDDLWHYLYFVLAVALAAGGGAAERLSHCERKARAHLADLTQVEFRKDDAAFVCGSPRWV